MNETEISKPLLAWYDLHARVLPWRISPASRKQGFRPDPYRVWLSEIMLQQTTVPAVKSYFHNFTHLWPTVQELAAADDDEVMAEWAGLGYYARARNLLACARIVTRDFGGVFPDEVDQLQKLPGIGPYTAAAIGAIAFDLPVNVVDGNVERVMARYEDFRAPLEKSKKQLVEIASKYAPEKRCGDYAQALMDLGATVCKPSKADCDACPIAKKCQGRQAGNPEALPARLPKKVKPVRRGFAYVARSGDGSWLLERRPPKGLLGGTLGWPCSDWSENPLEEPPFESDWTDLDAEVRHTFTHFHLRLHIRVTRTSDKVPNEGLISCPPEKFSPSDLPSVMRKVFDVASAHSLLLDT